VEEESGVTITVENLEPNFYFDQIYAENHGQLFSGGWCADYPDPKTLRMFSSTPARIRTTAGIPIPNWMHCSNARVEQNVTKRIEMYQQAEQIIVDDAAALFTVHYLDYQLVKPYVKDMH